MKTQLHQPNLFLFGLVCFQTYLRQSHFIKTFIWYVWKNRTWLWFDSVT